MRTSLSASASSRIVRRGECFRLPTRTRIAFASSDAYRAPNPEIRARSLHGEILRPAAATRLPLSQISPVSGTSSPAINRRSVVLPHPHKCAQRRLRRRQRRETRRRVPGRGTESFCDVLDRNEPGVTAPPDGSQLRRELREVRISRAPAKAPGRRRSMMACSQ